MVMAASVSEDSSSSRDSSPVEGLSSSQSVESLAEWRSSDQVENGTPSTSPPYWDLDDDDDDDCGPKPSDLYGKFTWKVENFSQSNKRELKSNVFEIGGYKWYILIYPQGCDVCNHLSLFLCVANYDKLLPGWSHFAQFTIAVMNKDSKKNKYSDTLHRFWKKEHDWGWKKFLELTKVMDGFVDNDTLTIKAQVQVIREKAHRPFRCLDCQYRRELIRVYLGNVEHNYSQFVKERRDKLRSLVEDKAKWSSFRAFWLGIDQTTRRYMSRDKKDAILKVVVKQFFVDKEVTSTLVMDSLYTGLKALESQSKIKKVRANLLEKEEIPAPIVFMENDMFVLADDVSVLVERAALELPHPPLPSKEEKGLPNRTKDGCTGDEFSKESILRDERRLTELGRRTLEIYVLSHIFSRIDVAYQEAVALKRQEELIREEEAAEQAENEKRERKTKKKQAKQRRNNQRAKDRVKNEKSGGMMNKNQLQNCPADDRILELSSHNEKVGPRNDDAGDNASATLQPDVEGRDASPSSWDTDTSEIQPKAETSGTEVQNRHAEKKLSPSMDDSSSTCSTDSVPSVVDNGPYKGNSSPSNKNNRSSTNRGKKQRNKELKNRSILNAGRVLSVSGTSRASGPEPENLHTLKEQRQRLEHRLVEKEEVAMTLGNKSNDTDQLDEATPSKPGTTEPSSFSANPSRQPHSSKQSTDKNSVITKKEKVSSPESTSNTTAQAQKSLSSSVSKSGGPKHNTTQVTTNTVSSMSRPASTPAILGKKPTLPLPPHSQSLSRTLSTADRLDSKPSPSAESFEPQSYRNAMMGIKTANGSSTARFTLQPSTSSSMQSTVFSQPPPSSSSSSSSLFFQTSQAAGWMDLGLSIGSVARANGSTRIGNYEPVAGPLRQSQGMTMQDEFPHLDIINDLLDEDQIVARTAFDGYHHNHQHHARDDYSFNQHYTFACEATASEIDTMSGGYYDEMSQYVPDSFMPYHGLGDVKTLQPDFSVYGNGVDPLLQSQWPIDGAADLSVLNFGSAAMDVNGYGYQIPDYSCDPSLYGMMYQPANGH